MIRTKAIPIILRVTSKIEIKPIIEKFKNLDLKSLDNGGTMSDEDKAILFFEFVSEIAPQLSKFENDIVPLVAALEDVSEEEAGNLDFFEVLKRAFENESLLSFFKSALTKNQG